jgi:hypothetical protein
VIQRGGGGVRNEHSTLDGRPQVQKPLVIEGMISVEGFRDLAICRLNRQFLEDVHLAQF